MHFTQCESSAKPDSVLINLTYTLAKESLSPQEHVEYRHPQFSGALFLLCWVCVTDSHLLSLLFGFIENRKSPSNVWQQFREWRFFSNLAMVPSSRFVLGVPRERLAMGVIEFWSNSSSSFLHRCLCIVAFQPLLLSYWDNFSSSFLCLVSLLLVSKVSFAIDGKHNVRLCLWRPQGVFSRSHVTLT